MVPVDMLRSAIDQLKQWRGSPFSNITWVNWRKGFQVKMHWKGDSTFACYLDFGSNMMARDTVLQHVFEKYAPAGLKPRIVDGHGWTALDHSMCSDGFVSVNDVAAIAEEMGYEHTILYVQSSVSSRPIFGAMGIPLVPGEMGKEWTGSEFISYSCPSGQNL